MQKRWEKLIYNELKAEGIELTDDDRNKAYRMRVFYIQWHHMCFYQMVLNQFI